ncbi:MAG: hypothetical protein QGI21_06090 [Candidatus Poseidoniaceae archaeon]|jgi:hypothetical protein|nr:hypothetical protein [Candidatus Poseidoniaceae archaeon]
MSSTEAMVTLQERIVNLVNQLSMPILETSLVVGKWTAKMSEHLLEVARAHGENLPKEILQPWELDVEPIKSNLEFDLEKALSIVDEDRMDILDTLIRVTIEETGLPMIDALLLMRSWEKLVREQLSQASGPGQLFSPTIIPEEF